MHSEPTVCETLHSVLYSDPTVCETLDGVLHSEPTVCETLVGVLHCFPLFVTHKTVFVNQQNVNGAFQSEFLDFHFSFKASHHSDYSGTVLWCLSVLFKNFLPFLNTTVCLSISFSQVDKGWPIVDQAHRDPVPGLRLGVNVKVTQ